MGEPQVIRTESGEELIVLTRREYDALLARLGDEEAEDAMTVRIVEESMARIAAGEDVLLPDAVWSAIEGGEHAIAVLRRFRGLTQSTLASQCSISQGFLSEIENRRKTGDVAVLKRIAAALAVPLDVIVD